MTCDARNRCIACQVGLALACRHTEARIRADERRRIAAAVSAGIAAGDLERLRTALVEIARLRSDDKIVRQGQLLVHELVKVLNP